MRDCWILQECNTVKLLEKNKLCQNVMTWKGLQGELLNWKYKQPKIESIPFYIHCDICSCVSLSMYQFSSVTQSCPTLCDPMDCSTPGLPVHHQLVGFTQTHVHCIGDSIQPPYPLSSLLLHHAFEDLSCSGVWCGHFEGNLQSRRVMEKCGFVYDHTTEKRYRASLGIEGVGYVFFLSRTRWGEIE